MIKKNIGVLNVVILVAALGYFVDIYDLLLFNIVRIESLRDIGLDDAGIKAEGEFIIGVQMLGLLIGGIIWGIMGDKRGRLSVLFGSIVLYSIANVINGFVTTPSQYAMVRFIAGIGLAGELGAGITLVSELSAKEKRGISTSLVAGVGLTGAVAAYFISQYFHWRTCYFIGGGLGCCLLFLRISVYESGMFEEAKQKSASRGDILLFFTNASRFKKYLLSVLVGLPTWFVIGILIAFSNNFAEAFSIKEPVSPKKATMYAYAAIAVADVLTGLISHWLKSRKKTLFIFYSITLAGIILFFNQSGGDAGSMYLICALLGFGTGFWAIFVTMAAEQFGTNLRATAATTIPNMVRGALPIMLLLFNALQHYFSYAQAGLITGLFIMLVSFIAAAYTDETFHKELNYIETK